MNEPNSPLPDLAQRAAFTAGPYVAAWLLLRLPVLGEVIPGDDDQAQLATFVTGTIIWALTYAWRWARSWLSRPPVPDALTQLDSWTDAMLALAAAASIDERAADAQQAEGHSPGTADGDTPDAAGRYDTTGDYEP